MCQFSRFLSKVRVKIVFWAETGPSHKSFRHCSSIHIITLDKDLYLAKLFSIFSLEFCYKIWATSQNLVQSHIPKSYLVLPSNITMLMKSELLNPSCTILNHCKLQFISWILFVYYFCFGTTFIFAIKWQR